MTTGRAAHDAFDNGDSARPGAGRRAGPGCRVDLLDAAAATAAREVDRIGTALQAHASDLAEAIAPQARLITAARRVVRAAGRRRRTCRGLGRERRRRRDCECTVRTPTRDRLQSSSTRSPPSSPNAATGSPPPCASRRTSSPPTPERCTSDDHRPQRRPRRVVRPLAARRRRGDARRRHQRQRRVRLPRRRPDDAARAPCAHGRRARRRRRRAGRLPRPRRLRPPLHRRRRRASWPTTCSTRSARCDGCAGWPARAVAYVKPHGALYNAVVHHEAQAAAVVDAVAALRPDAARARPARLGAAAGSPRRPGCRPCAEAFADRGYTAGRPRSCRGREPGARAARPGRRSPRACSGWSTTASVIGGRRLARRASTPSRSCVHGDTPGAVDDRARGAGAARRRRA